jgi:hypothetical protein
MRVSWHPSPFQQRTSQILHISLCACMCILHFVAGQRLGKRVPTAKNSRNRRIVGRVIFYAVRTVSKESLWVCLYRCWVTTQHKRSRGMKNFLRCRFLCVHVVSKENRRLVLRRTLVFYAILYKCNFRNVLNLCRLHPWWWYLLLFVREMRPGTLHHFSCIFVKSALLVSGRRTQFHSGGCGVS